MNKKLCLGLAIAMLFSLASCEKEPFPQEPKNNTEEPKTNPEPTPVEPAKPEPKAFEAGDFKEDMLKDGVLTLPEHFISITPASLDAHKAQIKVINAAGVTEIADNAFTGWEMLTAVDFPKATKVGNKAFEGCNGITKIEFPEVTEVGEESFLYCAGIKTLTLPKVNKVGNKALVQCNSLVEIRLPELTEVGDEAFSMCFSLTTCEFPKLSKVGSKAFTELYRLRKLTLGADKPQIAEDAFLNTSVAKVLYVPESAVATYTEWANKARFASINNEDEKLTNNFDNPLPKGVRIQTKNGVTSLKTRDEAEFVLTNFVLNHSVTVISESAFSGFENPDGELEGYFQALGVNKIEAGAFNSQEKLTFIEFPNAVDIHSGVFSNCNNLKMACLTKLATLRSTVFSGTGIEIVDLPNATNIEKNAFENCSKLKYLILGATPPSTPELVDKNSPLNDSIFGLDTGGSPVVAGQVTIVVPDGSEDKYASWVTKYKQVKAVIPVSKFKR